MIRVPHRSSRMPFPAAIPVLAATSFLAALFVCTARAGFAASGLDGEEPARETLTRKSRASAETPPSELEQFRDLESTVTRVVRAAEPAFAFIRSVREAGGDDRRRRSVESGGSGFVISADGLVLTNDHVVAGGNRILCYVTGGRMFPANVVGRDPQGDIALLRLEGAKDLTYLEFGDSDEIRIGERVIAIGDPFLLGRAPIFPSGAPPSFQPSVSSGVVSANHRYSDTYNDAIQVDLAVNRGNSGGPLLDLEGRVIGVNGKIETRFAIGVNTGVGYAVPSNQIRRFLEPLREAGGGIVRHGTIRGLEIAERAGSLAGLPIVGVEAGSHAEQGGLQPGDLILSIDGRRVPTRNRYLGIIATYPAGERVPIRIDRAGEIVEVTPTLVAPGRAYLGIETGASVAGEPGVRVQAVSPATPAARAGVAPGDRIVRFDDQEVANATELAVLLGRHEPGDLVDLKVVRGEETLDLELVLTGRID